MGYTRREGIDIIVGILQWAKSSSLHRFNEDEYFVDACLNQSPLKNRERIAELINYVMTKSIMCANNVVIEKPDNQCDVNAVVQGFLNLEPDEAVQEILASKIATLKGPSTKENIIKHCHIQLMQMKKEKEATESFSAMKRNSLDGKLLGEDGLQLLFRLEGWTFNVLTGKDIFMTVRQWLQGGEYEALALVLHGASFAGKTPCAEGLCAFLSKAYAKEMGNEHPYYIKTSTIDALRTAMPYLNPGTPVLLDEVTPSAKRGTRASASTNEVVKITTVADSTVVDARYSDIVVGEQVPRVFTSNAPNPESWFSELPKHVRYLTPEERLEQCNPFAIAVMKRCLFVKVHSNIIPEDLRSRFIDGKKESAKKRIRLMKDE